MVLTVPRVLAETRVGRELKGRCQVSLGNGPQVEIDAIPFTLNRQATAENPVKLDSIRRGSVRLGVLSVLWRSGMARRIGRKIGVLSALTLLATQVGTPVEAAEIYDLDERCAMYRTISDTEVLQRELERLLETSPDDECIGFLVDLIGGSPVAENPGPQQDPY
ncbi:hypothetical protein [Aliiroseovarius sp.]|uniref:hypothetical protein n=1 Tax=Aliiroseovarius sp. TaxID=1872442 RepID=UPI003BA871F3